ncbi:MAG: Alkaline phosphatase synthesis sensor protein PhoR [candidate division BRC1 bacterium ADurb.BinA292]|nr:MAG: Alkaline phosphatase synthesis sensor protein PhoR [candidate division BRC1 bacterium ADurb.BinA292]
MVRKSSEILRENNVLIPSESLGSERYLALFRELTPLIGSTDPEEICVRAGELIARLLGVEACSLMLVDGAEGDLRLVAATHIAPEHWPRVRTALDEGILGEVVRADQAVLIVGAAEFRRIFGRAPEARYRTPSCVIVPLPIQGRPGGVINVAHPTEDRLFHQRDVELLRAAAGLIGAALANAFQHQETLKLQQNLEDIFSSLHVGIVTVDENGRIRHTNQRARRMFGHTSRECLAELEDLLPEEVASLCRRLIEQLGSGQEMVQEPVRTTVNAQPLKLEVTVSSLSGIAGQGNDALVLFHDIGQEEEVRRLRESEKMKRGFLAIISHELRTPISVINGSLPMIDVNGGREVTNETLSQVHRLLRKNSQRLCDVVNAILDVTEIESGTLQLSLRQVDLPSMIEDILAVQAESASLKRVTWDVRFDSNLSRVIADKRRLRQVLTEMVANAIKFSHSDQKISILTRVQPPWVEIDISNRGVRIEPECRRTIFEKFQQGDQSTTRVAGGCGLGLFLARNILQLHGGSIELLETEGDLTTFRIRLPLPTDEEISAHEMTDAHRQPTCAT